MLTPHVAQMLCRTKDHITVIRMSAHERFSAQSPCSRSSLFSSSWTVPPRTSSSSLMPCLTTSCATIQRQEDNCRIAAHALPTGFEPNRLDISEEFNVHTSIFQSSDTNAIYHIDDDRDESAPAEIDDEKIRNVLTSPLFFMRAKQKPVREKLIKFV